MKFTDSPLTLGFN